MSRATNAQIAEGFLKGLTNFAQGYAKRAEKKHDEEIIQRMNDPNLSAVERAALIAKLSSKGQKSFLTLMALQNKLAHEQERERLLQEELDLRGAREKRLHGQNITNDMVRTYQARLGDIKAHLKDTYDQKEKQALREEQKALQKELGQNLARLKKGQRPLFDVLQIEEEPLPAQTLPTETMNQMGGLQQPSMQPQAKMQWDPNNPQHKAFAQEALQRANGNRALANQLISEQFQR